MQKKCNQCGRQYVLEEIRYPSRDEAHTIYCECGTELFEVESGTTDYRKRLVSGPTK